MSPKAASPGAFGPFLGMRFLIDPTNVDPRLAYYAENMIPADVLNGGAYIRRPSDQSTALASATTFQYLGVFRKRSGFVTVAIVDGQIYTLSATSWTLSVTTGNLATASVTLSATARCFAVTYNNTFVINDGVNQPFTWNGVAGAGGLVPLTNAPAKCYGAPTVYYGKLFFIMDVAANSVDRSTIQWSEENAANTGYIAGGYNNTWQLNQNGSGPLYAVKGTNNGLYYWRAEAIGVIHGAVTPTFTTAGVHDDVSAVLGTTCPDVLWYDGWLYFYDPRGRQWRFPEGGRPNPLWPALSDSYGGPDGPSVASLFPSAGSFNPALSGITSYPWLDGVVFGASSTASLNPIWLFSHITGRLLCLITTQLSTPPTIMAIGEVYDTTNTRTAFGMAGFTGGAVKVSLSPVVSGTFFDNTDGRIRNLIVGPFGGGIETVWSFTSVTATLVLGQVSTPRTGHVGLATSTSENPYGAYTPQGSAVSITQSAGYQTQVRKTWGFNSRLRWMNLELTEGTAGFEGWGVYQVSADGDPQKAEPDKP